MIRRRKLLRRLRNQLIPFKPIVEIARGIADRKQKVWRKTEAAWQELIISLDIETDIVVIQTNVVGGAGEFA
jgi:hypothetical protein